MPYTGIQKINNPEFFMRYVQTVYGQSSERMGDVIVIVPCHARLRASVGGVSDAAIGLQHCNYTDCLA